MTSTEPSPDLPDGTRRRRIRLAFSLFVAAQLAIPLSYYARADRYDERFAWRMFSAIRVESCESMLVESRDGLTQPVQLTEQLHFAWIEHLRRSRAAVIDRLLTIRCERPGTTRVELTNTCVDAEGEALPPRRFVRRCPESAR